MGGIKEAVSRGMERRRIRQKDAVEEAHITITMSPIILQNDIEGSNHQAKRINERKKSSVTYTTQS